jgi:hypothetical protein
MSSLGLEAAIERTLLIMIIDPYERVVERPIKTAEIHTIQLARLCGYRIES